MKKIYLVTISKDIMVVAKNQDEAEEIAESNIKDETGPYIHSLRQIKTIEEIPKEYKHTIPWSEENQYFNRHYSPDLEVENYLKE